MKKTFEQMLGKVTQRDSISTSQIGTAGVFLTLADLSIMGYDAFLAGEHLPYDIAVQMGGGFLKVQVKTTFKPVRRIESETPYYRFSVRRSSLDNGMSKRPYDNNDVDMFSLVALDSRVVGYLFPSETKRGGSISLCAREYMGLYSWELYRDIWDEVHKLKSTGMGIGEIAEAIDRSRQHVYLILSGKRSKAIEYPYLDELTLDDALENGGSRWFGLPIK